MSYSPLAILLEDLQRAGVTDLAGDAVFDMRAAKIHPLHELASAQKQEEESAKGSDMQALTSALKNKTPAVAVDVSDDDGASAPSSLSKSTSTAVKAEKPLVWAFGMEEPRIAVLISADVAKETAPLTGNAQKLFAKMMQAIELGAPDVIFFVMQEVGHLPDAYEAHVKDEMRTLIEQYKPQSLLVIGRAMQKMISDTAFCDKPCVALEHPATLLAHPAFKRKAWQALLTFKQTLTEED